MQILSFFPGQKVTIYLETIDGYGVRTDAITAPIITRVIFPSLTLATGYPQPMIKLDTGLYYYQFILPSGAASVGSYLAEVSYVNPANDFTVIESYHILVNAPFGNYSASVTV